MPVISGSSGGGSNVTLITSLTLTSPQASFDTNTLLGGNIGGTYNHLLMKTFLRGTTAGGATTANFRINNDSGANYSYVSTYGLGVSAAANTQLAATFIEPSASTIPAASGNTNAFAALVCELPFYTNTTGNKTFLSLLNGDGGGNNRYAVQTSAVWNNTAAITRISVSPGAGTWATGSAFFLYGVT